MLVISSKKEYVINIAISGTYFPDPASIISKINSNKSEILIDIKMYSNHLI